MQTGQVKHITHAKLVSSVKQNVTTDIYIDLRVLEYIYKDESDSDNNENYIFYKSEKDIDYCEKNTLLQYDFKTNTLKPLHIPIDYHANAAKIYNNMVFVATESSDIEVYNLTTSEHIKTLYTKPTGKSIYYLIDSIYIFESDSRNIFVFVKNYRYNTIWNLNTGEFIPYPKELQELIWNIYIDKIDSKVYLYSSHGIIVFTDTTFQQYKVIYKFMPNNAPIYRFDNYLHAGDIKFDVNTYETIYDVPPTLNFNCASVPYFRWSYILFKVDCDIVITDYNLQKLDSLTICDNSYDEIQQMYVYGNKAYCLMYDGSIKTITIYCTKKCAHDMNTFIETSEMFPPELCNIIMSYVEFNVNSI